MSDVGAWHGLVLGLCPCPSVLARLTEIMPVGSLGPNCMRLAACDGCLEAYRFEPSPSMGVILDVHPLALQNDGLAVVHGDEPLLRACFDCLSAIPSGAPWEGSWRENALESFQNGLRNGGLIIVLASNSLDEQRTWARALLTSGCAFVQVHNALELARSH
jgi:hypothetical protein